MLAVAACVLSVTVISNAVANKTQPTNAFIFPSYDWVTASILDNQKKDVAQIRATKGKNLTNRHPHLLLFRPAHLGLQPLTMACRATVQKEL
jgi:hypothetical protein